mmetsp:Transcript_119337/g.223147  ORF Transcript_119337/g.223147 Transcript_119337/m.223147 type:complete len:241 (+) Transcript_119337:87-809(+)
MLCRSRKMTLTSTLREPVQGRCTALVRIWLNQAQRQMNTPRMKRMAITKEFLQCSSAASAWASCTTREKKPQKLPTRLRTAATTALAATVLILQSILFVSWLFMMPTNCIQSILSCINEHTKQIIQRRLLSSAHSPTTWNCPCIGPTMPKIQTSAATRRVAASMLSTSCDLLRRRCSSSWWMNPQEASGTFSRPAEWRSQTFGDAMWTASLQCASALVTERVSIHIWRSQSSQQRCLRTS